MSCSTCRKRPTSRRADCRTAAIPTCRSIRRTSASPIRTSFDADALLANLRITEIMYNPVGAQTFEFIELRNNSPTESLDLTGVAFTGGIDFEFGALTLGPNQYVVVAKDIAAFQSRYCGGVACAAINVVGPFLGQLDNTGENIELTLPDPFDGTIQTFDSTTPGTRRRTATVRRW